MRYFVRACFARIPFSAWLILLSVSLAWSSTTPRPLTDDRAQRTKLFETIRKATSLSYSATELTWEGEPRNAWLLGPVYSIQLAAGHKFSITGDDDSSKINLPKSEFKDIYNRWVSNGRSMVFYNTKRRIYERPRPLTSFTEFRHQYFPAGLLFYFLLETDLGSAKLKGTQTKGSIKYNVYRIERREQGIAGKPLLVRYDSIIEAKSGMPTEISTWLKEPNSSGEWVPAQRILFSGWRVNPQNDVAFSTELPDGYSPSE